MRNVTSGKFRAVKNYQKSTCWIKEMILIKNMEVRYVCVFYDSYYYVLVFLRNSLVFCIFQDQNIREFLRRFYHVRL